MLRNYGHNGVVNSEAQTLRIAGRPNTDPPILNLPNSINALESFKRKEKVMEEKCFYSPIALLDMRVLLCVL